MRSAEEILQWACDEALGQCLVEWNGLSYAEVIARLQLADEANDRIREIDLLEGIIAWQPFESMSYTNLADQLDSLRNSYVDMAQFVLGGN